MHVGVSFPPATPGDSFCQQGQGHERHKQKPCHPSPAGAQLGAEMLLLGSMGWVPMAQQEPCLVQNTAYAILCLSIRGEVYGQHLPGAGEREQQYHMAGLKDRGKSCG